MERRLTDRVDPDYPPLAKQALIHGTVVFRIVVGKDGTVQNLTLLSGHPLLVPAAQQAVRQWRYAPFIVDGKPIEVQSVVKVLMPPARPPSPEVEQYRQNVRLHPDDAEAHYRLGVALANGNSDWNDAIAEFHEAVRMRPNHAETHARLAEVLESKHKVDEAIQEYREAIRLKPDAPDPHRKLANLLMTHGDYNSGLAEYRELARLKPEDKSAYQALGRALYQKGPADRATAEFREILNKRTDAAELHAALAFSLGEGAPLIWAIAEYQEVSRLKPADSAAQQTLDHLVKEKAKEDESIAKLRRWLRRKPDDAEAGYVLSYALFVIDGDGAGAVNVLEEVVRLKPDDVVAVLRLARSLALREPGRESAADFRERVRRNPQSAGLHTGLGNLLQTRGDFDGAVAEFREAVRLKPDNPDIHMYLSGALVSNGDTESAKAESALARQLAKPEVEDATGVALLRALNVACQSYKSKYNSYPPGLQSLGMPDPTASPSAAAADLIDPLLADGHRSGYQFTYKPGDLDGKSTIQTLRLTPSG